MKALILTSLIALSSVTMFTGCDKPNYQSPRAR